MTGRIKFALEMAGGKRVRTMAQLQASFDFARAVGYFQDGRLVQWLEDRHEEERAEALRGLDAQAADFAKTFCGVLGVPQPEEKTDFAEIAADNEKRERLRQKTDDEAILAHAKETAFDQAELNELIAEGAETIYLCGKHFEIPPEQQGKHYIGLFEAPQVDVWVKSRKTRRLPPIAGCSSPWPCENCGFARLHTRCSLTSAFSSCGSVSLESEKPEFLVFALIIGEIPAYFYDSETFCRKMFRCHRKPAL